jgi:hypothetical protein
MDCQGYERLIFGLTARTWVTGHGQEVLPMSWKETGRVNERERFVML